MCRRPGSRRPHPRIGGWARRRGSAGLSSCLCVQEPGAPIINITSTYSECPGELLLECGVDRARHHDGVGVTMSYSPAVILTPVNHRDTQRDPVQLVAIAHLGPGSFDMEHIAETDVAYLASSSNSIVPSRKSTAVRSVTSSTALAPSCGGPSGLASITSSPWEKSDRIPLDCTNATTDFRVLSTTASKSEGRESSRRST